MRAAIIVARGGSKRIPRKNLRPFLGKPIIAYSITTARESHLFDRVYVSTEDSEIADVAHRYGAVELERPTHLAADDVGTPEVMRYHAGIAPCVYASFLCCIYPTAPMMTVADLARGLEELKRYGADYSFSIGTDPLCDAGQWYWGTREAFANGRPLFSTDTLMVPIDPERVCDINTEPDWQRAERMYAALQKAAA